MTDLATLRRTYARNVLATAGVTSPALERAYATVAREAYVGPGPWTLYSARGQVDTADASPAHLYANVLVALLPEKRINNGEPSGHAMWLAAANPKPGDHVVHIGVGTGYYTAILAELVGPTGQVTAIEYDAHLAKRAEHNLAAYRHVTIVHADGVIWPFAPADVIYVNAGVTRPADLWLDRLKDGGRLVLPLTASGQHPPGAVFCFTRHGDAFAARYVSPTAFIPCEGLRDEGDGDALAEAFAKGGAQQVTRLVRGAAPPERQCWLRGNGWSLCY
ncbi:MAG: methyltransferase domain-containing protein [Sphingomonadales bacterium]|nr:MAG: methyltransferase domain-containing protein [Sphingomonadales bacterium]